MRLRSLLVPAVAGLLVVGSAGAVSAAAPLRPAGSTPASVYDVHAASRSSSTIALAWRNPSSPSFRSTVIRAARGKRAPRSVDAGVRIARVPRGRHTVTARHLVAASRYAFAIFATDGHGHVAGPVDIGAVTGPAPITDLQSYDHLGYDELRWSTPPAASYAGTIVRLHRGTAIPATVHDGQPVALPSPRPTHIGLGHLPADTTYTVAVWTRDADGHLSTRAMARFSTPSAATPPAHGTISGTITDSAGSPLRGVVVAAYDFDFGMSRQATTTADGRYALTLPAGVDFLGIDGSQATGGNSDATGYLGDDRDIDVTAGSVHTGVDAHLDPGGAITGRVTDARGHPLSGVQVSPVPVQPYVQVDSNVSISYLFLDTDQASVTNPSGRYTLKGVYPGAVQPCFTASQQDVGDGSGRVIGYADRCAQRTAAVGPRQRVALPDVPLHAKGGGTLSGTVTASDGRAVSGTEVYVNARNHRSDGGFGQTDSAGHYRLTGLAAGAYQLCAEPRSGQGNARTGDQQTCVPADIVRGQVTRRDVATRPGGAVSGKLTTTSGAPVTGASAGVEGIGIDEYGDGTTDPSGHFTARGLGGGMYRACFDTSTATAPGRPTGVLGACNRHRRHLAVRTGSTRIGVDAVLPVGGAISGVVRTEDGAALPYAGVEVDPANDPFSENGAFVQTDEHGRYTVPGLATGDYRVCFENVSVISFVQQCYRDPDTGSRNVAVAVGRTTAHIDHDFSVGGAIQATVRDQAGHPVTGVDAVALAPCGQGYCERQPLLGPGQRGRVAASGITGPDGAVTLDDLRAGTYAVCLFAYFGATTVANPATGFTDRCLSSSFSLTVGAHGTTAASGVLAPAGELTGRITDGTGHGLAGVIVHVSGSAADDYPDAGYDDFDPFEDDSPVAGSITAADGTYDIRGVAPGSQTVCADPHRRGDGYRDRCLGAAPGSTHGGTPVTITASRVTRAPDLVLTPGGSVTDPDAAAAAERGDVARPPAGSNTAQRFACLRARLGRPECVLLPANRDGLDGTSAIVRTATGTIIRLDPRTHHR